MAEKKEGLISIRPNQAITQEMDNNKVEVLKGLISQILTNSTIPFVIHLNVQDGKYRVLNYVKIDPNIKDKKNVTANIKIRGKDHDIVWSGYLKLFALKDPEPQEIPPPPPPFTPPPQIEPLVPSKLLQTPPTSSGPSKKRSPKSPSVVKEISFLEEEMPLVTESMLLEKSFEGFEQKFGTSEKLQELTEQLEKIRRLRALRITQLEKTRKRITEWDIEDLNKYLPNHSRAKELVTQIAENNKYVDGLIAQERQEVDEEIKRLHSSLNRFKDQQLSQQDAELELSQLLQEQTPKDIIFATVDPLRAELTALQELFRYTGIPQEKLKQIEKE